MKLLELISNMTFEEMEVNVEIQGNWVEELLDSMETSLPQPEMPPFLIGGTHVSFNDFSEEAKASLLTKAAEFGFDLGARLGNSETSDQVDDLLEKQKGGEPPNTNEPTHS